MRPLEIRRHIASPSAYAWPSDLHSLLARVFAARGLAPQDVARRRLADLATPSALGGIDRACERLSRAIDADEAICIVGDFDADGATATALAVRGLRMLGARRVLYRVPHRMRGGYGLSAGLVESLCDRGTAIKPTLIVTVDNGVASHAGVARANESGVDVIITDHHLPGASLPAALAIINPNLGGDGFPSKALAGVGVAFYVLLALRAFRRERGLLAVDASKQPDLGELLDLVALGTVADLVALDANNRILVAAGLKRIRTDRCCAGIKALFRVAGREIERATASDLGFAIAPRINAAGRLDDMSIGIECLLTDDIERADVLATELSRINAERQHVQTTMVEDADAKIAALLAAHADAELPYGVVLHDDDWHPGVVGLVASKVKERLNRPVVACAPAAPGSDDLRCSARSIAGFHLRDALAEVDAGAPGLIDRFGGHAMAAGLTMPADHLQRFAEAFDAVARGRLGAEMLDACVYSDGELHADDLTLAVAEAVADAGPWGQGFAEPTFDNVFEVASWRVVGERHLKLVLQHAGRSEALDAILFNASIELPPPGRIRAVYQLNIEHWNSQQRLRLMLRYIEAA